MNPVAPTFFMRDALLAGLIKYLAEQGLIDAERIKALAIEELHAYQAVKPDMQEEIKEAIRYVEGSQQIVGVLLARIAAQTSE